MERTLGKKLRKMRNFRNFADYNNKFILNNVDDSEEIYNEIIDLLKRLN